MLLRSSALTTWCPAPFKVSPRAASVLARLSQSAAAEFRSLDQEIRSVFVPDYIITRFASRTGSKPRETWVAGQGSTTPSISFAAPSP